jgi:hypothetical protein
MSVLLARSYTKLSVLPVVTEGIEVCKPVLVTIEPRGQNPPDQLAATLVGMLFYGNTDAVSTGRSRQARIFRLQEWLHDREQQVQWGSIY